MILADLGAEVIRVEQPGGDKTRKLTGPGMGFCRSFNRNKESVVIDTVSLIWRRSSKRPAFRMPPSCAGIGEHNEEILSRLVQNIAP